MDLVGAGSNCRLPDYPTASNEPAAVNYIDDLGVVVACGGFDLADASKCWAFDGSSWTPLPDIDPIYGSSPNLMVDSGWWVTGKGV